MTITLQEFAKEKKLLPAWMLNHPVFKYPDKIEKIFPNIGLSNCSAQCDLSGNFAMDEAKQFLKNIKAELVAPFDGFEHNKQYPLMSLIQQLENILTDRIDDCIQLVRGEIILKTPEKIVISENRTLAANTDFFTVYQECFLVFSGAGWSLQKWEKIPGFKEFDGNNVSSDKSSIVFSSSGADGLWDIATMSMRGIKSCVRWDGQHKLTLIGSIIDPFTGVIYLTSGKEEKLGKRMIKRCIVRFVVNGETGIPYLLIDRMYPSLSKNVLQAFKQFLTSRTKFDVQFGPDIPQTIINQTYIPKTHITETLSEKVLPYRDTKVVIGKTPSKITERKHSNIEIKKHNLSIKLKKSISFIECIKQITDLSTNNILNTADFQYLIELYVQGIIAKIEKQYKPLEDQSSSDYIKQMCYWFFANKKDIIKSENARFTRMLSKYYAPRLNNSDTHIKLSQKHLKPMFDYLLKKISSVMKEEVITIISPTKKDKHNKKQLVVENINNA